MSCPSGLLRGRRRLQATAALEDTRCLLLPRADFFGCSNTIRRSVRVLLYGMTQRLVELTNRVAQLSGGRVEARLARLFLKLAEGSGRPERGAYSCPSCCPARSWPI